MSILSFFQNNYEAIKYFLDTYFDNGELGNPFLPSAGWFLPDNFQNTIEIEKQLTVANFLYGDSSALTIKEKMTQDAVFSTMGFGLLKIGYEAVNAYLDGGKITLLNKAIDAIAKEISEGDGFPDLDLGKEVFKDKLADCIKNGSFLDMDLKAENIKGGILSQIKDVIAEKVFSLEFSDKNVFNLIDQKLMEEKKHYEDVLSLLNKCEANNTAFAVSDKDKERVIGLQNGYTAAIQMMTDLIKKNQEFVSERVETMNEALKDFVERYMTTEDVSKAFTDALCNQMFNQEDGQTEYILFKSKADASFGKDTPFSQLYAFSRLSLYYEEQNKLIENPYPFYRWMDSATNEKGEYVGIDGWNDPNSKQGKMNIWNSEIGKAIADAVNEKIKLIDHTSDRYRDDKLRLTELYTKAAMESGLAVKSTEDPRLQFMDDFRSDYGTTLAILRGNATDIIETQSGQGPSVADILTSYTSGSKSNQLDMAEMMDNIMTKWEHGGDDFTDIHDNDSPSSSSSKSSGFGTKDMAHRYLQIVDWAEDSIYGDPNTNVCDPKGDPIVDSETGYPLPDELDTDPELNRTEARKLYAAAGSSEYYEADDPKKRPSKLPVISAITYSQWPDPHASSAEYTIVFKELKGDDQTNFQNIVKNRDIKAFAEYYLNPAFEIYQQLIKDGIDPRNITFLGYDEGGAIAAALSAALHSGAFTQDGKFDGALAAYGWSLDKNGEVIDNYPAISVETYTFGSAPMGWLFQKPVLTENPPTEKMVISAPTNSPTPHPE